MRVGTQDLMQAGWHSADLIVSRALLGHPPGEPSIVLRLETANPTVFCHAYAGFVRLVLWLPCSRLSYRPTGLTPWVGSALDAAPHTSFRAVVGMRPTGIGAPAPHTLVSISLLNRANRSTSVQSTD